MIKGFMRNQVDLVYQNPVLNLIMICLLYTSSFYFIQLCISHQYRFQYRVLIKSKVILLQCKYRFIRLDDDRAGIRLQLTAEYSQAVSYTHLDVYKRQIYTGFCGSTPSFLRRFRICTMMVLFAEYIYCLLYTSRCV